MSFYPLFSIPHCVCIQLCSFQSPCLFLTSAMSTQGLLGWVSQLVLVAAGWQEEGWKVMIPLVRAKPSMNSFKVNNSLRPTWKPKGGQLIWQSSCGMCSEQKVLPTRQVATGSSSKWPLRTAWGGACCCALQWQLEEELCTMFPIQNCLAQQTHMKVFGFAANRASNKFPEAWAQCSKLWLCMPNPSICDCCPALAPSLVVTQPDCPHQPDLLIHVPIMVEPRWWWLLCVFSFLFF